MTLLKKLATEIKDHSEKWYEVIFDTDELNLLCSANEILNQFDNSDWEELNTELIYWSNPELEILAETIIMGCEGNESVENNDTLGFIFSLVDLKTASNLLTNDIGDYLTEYKIESDELVNKMTLKLIELKNEKYLNEKEYLLWLNRIKLKKASR
jgi:hypothetical protein